MGFYGDFSDQELIALIKQQDQFALAEIYNRHWGQLYIHAVKMTQEEAEAEDIVQEVFIGLWTNVMQLDVKTSLMGYLFSAVRNKVLNAIRNKKTRAGYMGLFSMYVEHQSLDALDYIHEKELLAAINKIIETLPDKMRETFELSRKGNKSHKQIALELGVSEATVKKQVNNALKILKSELKKPENLIIAVIFYHYR